MKPSSKHLPCLLAFAVLSGFLASARAQTGPALHTLYSLAQSPGALAPGSDGNFYGATGSGGNSDSGTIFKITPIGVLTTLFDFSKLDPDGRNLDGQSPLGALVQGTDGNFYGVTSRGGLYTRGTFFRMTPAGTLTTLHAFGKNDDDVSPSSGLLRGGDGNFYGVSRDGGVNDDGTVFQATPDGVVTNFYDFPAGTGPTAPHAALAQDADGNFYGVTAGGGAHGVGTVFRLSSDGATLTVLHDFTATDANGANLDGTAPQAALTRGRDGNFYSVTETGGARGAGVVFKVTPAGNFVNLHTFNPEDDDGLYPYASLTLGRNGYLYGTTEFGGVNGTGTIFQIKGSGVETVLYSFTSTGNTGTNLDGARPLTALVQSRDNNFYGTTLSGGSGEGTIFSYDNGSLITSPLTASLTFGQPFNYQITGTGSPKSFGALGLPSGLHINPATGLISGTIAAGPAGGSHQNATTYKITIKAGNAAGTGSATLIVTAAYPLPVITSPASVSGKVGQFFSYQITATNNPTRFTVNSNTLPPHSDVHFSPGSGMLTLSPTAAGTFTTGVRAFNKDGYGFLPVTITIDP